MLIPGQVKTYWIPKTDVGTYRTLQIMAQVVNESLVDPYVVYKAKSIVQSCPERNTLCHAQNILEWIKSHTSFLRDPSGVELLHTPKFQLQAIDRNGYLSIDCDDFSILAASLGKAVGMRAKFVILGFLENNAPFTHVYTVLEVSSKKWLPVDQRSGGLIPRRFITKKEFYNV